METLVLISVTLVSFLWCLNCYFMYGKSLNFKTQASRSVLHYPCDLVWIPAGLVGCNNSCSHLNNLWQWKILYLLLAAGVIVATRRDFFQERRCYQNKFKKLKCYCFTLSECAIKMYKWIWEDCISSHKSEIMSLVVLQDFYVFSNFCFIWLISFVCVFLSDWLTVTSQREAAVPCLQFSTPSPVVWQSWTWVIMTCRILEWNFSLLDWRVRIVHWKLWGQESDFFSDLLKA